MLSSKSPLPEIRCAIRGVCFNTSIRAVMSFHMTNLPKEKCPIRASARTSHPFISLMACLKICITNATSTPESSVGRGDMPGMVKWYWLRSSSNNVSLMIVSPSTRESLIPSFIDLRCNRTGSKRMGARYDFSSRSETFHSTKPIARYSVLTPPSSKSVLP